MHASFSRTLGVVGLLAISLTGCQSASLGKFSWNPKNWKFGRKSDTALAANNATTPSADAAASPWTPQLPSQTATPGYGSQVPNSGYAATSNQYGPGAYPAIPTNYAADASQTGWGQPGATAPPSSDPNAYAGAPATPQAGYYGDYGAAQPSGYTQPQAGYGAPMTAAPTQQPANAWDPATQYGPAPTGYPQQPQYTAPAAQLADNTQYPAPTQYDGTQQAPAYGAQPAYGTQPGYGAPTGYETPTQQPATQGYPQQYQPTGPAPTPQPYRPGGTSDYAPSTGSQVTPASYEPSQPTQGYGP